MVAIHWAFQGGNFALRKCAIVVTPSPRPSYPCPMTTSNKGPWLLAYVALGTVWGCSFLFIKWSLFFLTPFGVAFVRCALGALSLFVMLLASRLRYPRELAVWGHLVVVALCLNVVPGVLFAIAETRTTSILAGSIEATGTRPGPAMPVPRDNRITASQKH